jgi:hypothetical protein
VDPQETIRELLERCRRDHHAFINGDATAYAMPSGGTMMPSCGGVGRSGPMLDYIQSEARGMCEWGVGEVELIEAGISGVVAWLVLVEDAEVRFAGRDAPMRWRLRVTELFRRNARGAWERFHRHADPLVEGHQLDEVLPLSNLRRVRDPAHVK